MRTAVVRFLALLTLVTGLAFIPATSAESASWGQGKVTVHQTLSNGNHQYIVRVRDLATDGHCIRLKVKESWGWRDLGSSTCTSAWETYTHVTSSNKQIRIYAGSRYQTIWWAS